MDTPTKRLDEVMDSEVRWVLEYRRCVLDRPTVIMTLDDSLCLVGFKLVNEI